jgi:peptide/nickel transport system permease protein
MADIVSGFLFAIGLEVTLSVLGLSDLESQSIGTMIYWGLYYQALLSNRTWVLIAPVAASIVIVFGFYLLSVSLSSYLDPRTRLSRLQVLDKVKEPLQEEVIEPVQERVPGINP